MGQEGYELTVTDGAGKPIKARLLNFLVRSVVAFLPLWCGKGPFRNEHPNSCMLSGYSVGEGIS